jgi:hypothetical protein
VSRFAIGAVALAVGLTACGTSNQKVKVQSFRSFEVTRVEWTVGRDLSLYLPLPGFDKPVRLTGLTLVASPRGGSIGVEDVHMLVLDNGQYRSSLLTYPPRDLHGGHLVPLHSVLVRPRPNQNLGIVATIRPAGAGCHEGQVLLSYTFDGHKTRVMLPWYVGVDTAVRPDKLAAFCTGQPVKQRTH